VKKSLEENQNTEGLTFKFSLKEAVAKDGIAAAGWETLP
jgi:hypothetical protein